MAFTTNDFTWMSVSAGTRTRIFQGPLVHAAPVQWLEFGTRGGRDLPLTFTAAVYSAAAPWYLTTSGPATAWSLIPGQLGGLNTGMAPWNDGFPLWLSSSPWVEIFVTPTISCLAHVVII